MLWKILCHIYDYFLQDPLRILTLLGGSGGVAYWISLYRNRTRLRVSLIDLGLSPKSGQQKATISFEAENFGTTPNSLEASIVLKGYILKDILKNPNAEQQQRVYPYLIESNDRNLPPHVPKKFTATSSADDLRPFLLFMTYTFAPTRGRARRIHVRSVDGSFLSSIRFFCELFCELIVYRVFSKLPWL